MQYVQYQTRGEVLGGFFSHLLVVFLLATFTYFLTTGLAVGSDSFAHRKVSQVGTPADLATELQLAADEE